MKEESKYKVLFVLPSSTFGGAERVTFNILKGLDFFTPVLLTQKDLNPYFSSLNIEIYNFEDYSCIMPDISIKNILAYVKAIKNVTDIVKPSIIFGVMHFASLFITIAKEIYISLKKIPSVTSIHGTYSSHFESIKRAPTLKEKLLILYLLKRSKNILVPSIGIRDDLINNFRLDNKKFSVIYNGFDLDQIKRQSKEKISLNKDCSWIVTASRLGPPKDFDTLLKAFRIIRDKINAKLLIIGEGPYEQRIKDIISELKLDNDVYMLGFQDNPFKYIARSDVFVLSSLSEGLPSSIIEAMALGIPVVATNCPSGPSEIIRDRINGFLVPVGEPEKLASKVLFLSQNDELRHSISIEASKRAQYFSIETMCALYKEYFLKLLKETPYDL